MCSALCNSFTSSVAYSVMVIQLPTWFVHVHGLDLSFQHAEKWFLVRGKVVKLMLCRCKTGRKRHDRLGLNIRRRSAVVSPIVDTFPCSMWHIHVYWHDLSETLLLMLVISWENYKQVIVSQYSFLKLIPLLLRKTPFANKLVSLACASTLHMHVM